MRASRSPALLVIVLSFHAFGCRGENSSRSDCRFVHAGKLLKVDDDLSIKRLEVARPNTNTTSLVIVDYRRVSDDGTRVTGTAIDLRTGQRTRTSIPYRNSGEDRNRTAEYTNFVSGLDKSDAHPLIVLGTLRFEFLGRKRKIPYLERNLDGKWSVDREELFTGTRRLVYGNRTLLEQDFVSMRELSDDVWDNVQIEPDGDRIVCKCVGNDGTWIGIYSKRKLELEQAGTKGP